MTTPEEGNRNNRTGLVAAVALPVFLVLLAAPYALLPSLMESRVADDLRSAFDLSSKPRVNLDSSSNLAALRGDFEGGEVVMERPRLGQIRPQRVVVELAPFELEMPRSLLGSPASEEPLSGSITALLSEGQLESLASSRTQGIPLEGIRLSDGLMVVNARADVLGAEVPVSVAGRPTVEDNRLIFRPTRLEAFGVDVSEEAPGELLEGAAFSYNFEDLPMNARMTGVKVGQGRLELTGRVENIPLDGRGQP